MYPSTFNGAAGIFVHEQVKALVEKGIEVRVVSPVPWTPFPIKHLKSKWRAYSQIPYRDNWEGIDVHYPRYLRFSKAFFLASSGQWMYRGIKGLVDKIYRQFSFDLIHAHVALPDGFVGMLLAQKYHKPLVVTIHGQDLNYTIFKSTKCRRAVQQVIEAAARTIVVSHKLKQVAEKHLANVDRVTVINNGINPGRLFHKSSSLAESWQGKWVILSVSHLIQAKGIDLNLGALSQLVSKYPNLYYIIVGGGPIRKDLERLTKDLGLERYVEFTGQQPYSKVMEYMAMCDIFSLPSWQEGFGVVYIEAMAHGKPVIGCQGEGIEDVIEHGKTGLLVKSRDIDSLVDALDFLLNHPEEAQAIGGRARKHVLENYTWEKNAEKAIKVYEKALNAP